MIAKLRKLDFLGWIYGLLSAVIGGGASSVTAAVAASIIKPDDFALAGAASIKLMMSCFMINAVISMFLYLKQSPLPKILESSTTTTDSVTTIHEVTKP
jgi:hypothetical protein